MSKQANPTVVGAFVVGATVLAIGGVLAFGSGRVFQKEHHYVAFFEDSVAGLDVGAPVRFKGVSIGNVADISAVWTDHEDIHIPVEIKLRAGAIEPNNLQSEQRSMDPDAFLEHLIRHRGLRAELNQDSILTGKLFIALNFRPETPLRRVGGTDLVEIPTTEAGLAKIKKKLEDLPIEELMRKATDAVEAIDQLARDPAIGRVLSSLSQVAETLSTEVAPMAQEAHQAMADIRGLVARVDAEVEPVSRSVQDAVADLRAFLQVADTELDAVAKDLRSLVTHLDEELPPLTASASSTLAEVEGTVAGLREALGPDYRILYRMSALLEELTGAAQSVRVLAEYLERHPEALLSGKDG